MPEKPWWIGNAEQGVLAILGVGIVMVGATVDRDKGNLALTLVGVGVLLTVLAILVPRLQSFSAKVPGLGEISANLVPPSTQVNDAGLAPADHPERDLRGADAYGSNSADFQRAVTGGPATFVTINLEGGKAWLSSRLYVFVSALAELRGIEAVAFTTRRSDERINTFAGLCSADVLLTRLAWAYPWLPKALAAAWEEVRLDDVHRPPRRRLSNDNAQALFTKYVAGLQLPTPAAQQPPVGADLPLGATGPAARREEEWQDFNGVSEHANWLDLAAVTDLVGAGLTKDFVIGTSKSAEAVQAALASSAVQYIAVLDDRKEIRSVIDRSKLLARMLVAQGIAGPRG